MIIDSLVKRPVIGAGLDPKVISGTDSSRFFGSALFARTHYFHLADPLGSICPEVSAGNSKSSAVS
jgi:hypothetical protein